jgi:hypothetical protein
MKNDGDEILLRELEVIFEDGADETAHRITDSIYQVSNRLNSLRPVVRIRAATDFEGRYVHMEVNRLQADLRILNRQYMQLHNMQLKSALQFNRPLGNTPD